MPALTLFKGLVGNVCLRRRYVIALIKALNGESLDSGFICSYYKCIIITRPACQC